ncbi:serine hydrolase domain-containing protein [Haloglomus litoreum]|uniref:serine hydrolase domain-containing protein n=1 Tax=Haloglomus litoreum TaxID=3034026 RepID=UPI0023E8D351|nr:serine hydrolase domain-containing protein [Haloglomus sp. DT116]
MPSDALPDATARELDGFLEDWLADEDVPGVSVAVVDTDGLRYAAGLGARSLEPRAPATPDTRYAVASLAKPVVATGVLQLAEREGLALDDAVADHLPVLADAPGEPVTVGDLLSHSSGLPRDFVATHRDLADRAALCEHMDSVAERRLTDRRRYAYSNGGYMLLGEVIESVDGRPFRTYLADEVLAPLGMDRSGFESALFDDEDVMTGYAPGDDGPKAAGPDPEEIDHAGASGGLLATVTDLSRLLRCVLNGGELDGTRLLEPGSVGRMTTRQSPPLPTVDGSEPGYGYGWEVSELLGERLVTHRGGLGVASAYVGLLPERGVGVALGFNSGSHPTVTAGKSALALACGEDPMSVVDELRITRAVERVTGTYEAHGGRSSVAVSASFPGTVEVRLGGEDGDRSFTAAHEVVEADRYVFETHDASGVRMVAEFRLDDHGVELRLSMGKWTTVFTRA